MWSYNLLVALKSNQEIKLLEGNFALDSHIIRDKGERERGDRGVGVLRQRKVKISLACHFSTSKKKAFSTKYEGGFSTKYEVFERAFSPSKMTQYLPSNGINKKTSLRL